MVVLLFTPVKSRIQETLDRLFYRERYSSRKALVRLSQDLNADLDLERTSERLLEGVERRWACASWPLFLPGEDGERVPFRTRGVPRAGSGRPDLRAAARSLARWPRASPVDVDGGTRRASPSGAPRTSPTTSPAA